MDVPEEGSLKLNRWSNDTPISTDRLGDIECSEGHRKQHEDTVVRKSVSYKGEAQP
jgi:hypothetical protein